MDGFGFCRTGLCMPTTFEDLAADAALLIRHVESSGVCRFTSVAGPWLDLLWQIDELYATGAIDQGRHRTRGLWFQNLVAALVSNAAGIEARERTLPGFFGPVRADIAAVSGRVPSFWAEVKLLGCPSHPGNRASAGDRGRPANADIVKRMEEASQKTLSLAAANCVPEGQLSWDDGVVAGDLLARLVREHLKPPAYVFVCARAVDAADRAHVVAKSRETVRVLHRRCGALIVSTNEAGDGYQWFDGGDDVDLDSVIADVAGLFGKDVADEVGSVDVEALRETIPEQLALV